MMTKLEMAAKLRECAQWVRDHGFVRWSRYHSDYQRCALGIMEGVLGGASGRGLEIELLAPELLHVAARPFPKVFDPGHLFNEDSFRIAAWNNAPERTANDLIEHFDGVALQLEIEVLAEEEEVREDAPEGPPAPEETEKEAVPV